MGLVWSDSPAGCGGRRDRDRLGVGRVTPSLVAHLFAVGASRCTASPRRDRPGVVPSWSTPVPVVLYQHTPLSLAALGRVTQIVAQVQRPPSPHKPPRRP